jgi:hypothetical protein
LVNPKGFAAQGGWSPPLVPPHQETHGFLGLPSLVGASRVLIRLQFFFSRHGSDGLRPFSLRGVKFGVQNRTPNQSPSAFR